MAIIAPTIDEFDEPTVMLIIRNLVKWIQTDLVPQINANDIVSATQTSDGLSFDINLIKGDGSQIPVGKITLEDEDNIASGSFHFDDETRMLSGTLLKEDGTPINIPAVEIPGGSGTQIDYGIQTIQFTYQGNNLSCVITQKDGTQTTSNTVMIAGGGGTGGNPYPTAISGTVGEDGNITLTMTMSEGSPVTATINMSYFASAEDVENIQISTTVSQDSTNVIKISNAVNGNSADLTLDLSVVDGELILTAEDGTNQATSKVEYNISDKTKFSGYICNNSKIRIGDEGIIEIASSVLTTKTNVAVHNYSIILNTKYSEIRGENILFCTDYYTEAQAFRKISNSVAGGTSGLEGNTSYPINFSQITDNLPLEYDLFYKVTNGSVSNTLGAILNKWIVFDDIIMNAVQSVNKIGFDDGQHDLFNSFAISLTTASTCSIKVKRGFNVQNVGDIRIYMTNITNVYVSDTEPNWS